MLDLYKALPTFVVTLREGFEAALVVGIVLACLKKANQVSAIAWVYRGVVGGLLASILIGLSLGGVLEGASKLTGSYNTIVREYLAGILGVVACILLSWMLFWMSQKAKSMRSEIESLIDNSLNHNGDREIFSIVFVAVLREGFESVIFVLAQLEGSIWQAGPIIGAFAGLLVAVLMAFLLLRWGIAINIKLFFQVMGILLILIVGGLVVGVLNQFNIATTLLSQLDPSKSNWCIFKDSCILGRQVWDASSFLPDRQFPGIILKSLFGYHEVIYSLQLILYLVLVGSLTFFYFRSLLPSVNKEQIKSC